MIYVCGDIHGQFKLFRELLKTIHFSEDDVMYLVGDIIDRGSDSIPLMQYIMEHENIIPVLGNHELMMYAHYRLYLREDPWLFGGNGSQKTRVQFQKLSKEEREHILDYIYKMPLQKEVSIGNKTFLISHSCFLNKEVDSLTGEVRFDGDIYWKDVPYYIVEDLVWKSPWRYAEYVPIQDYEEDGRIHIIGHVPVLNIPNEDWISNQRPKMPCAYDNHNIINIDLGCAAMNAKFAKPEHLALCCVCLDEYVKGKNAFYYIEDNKKGDNK